KRFEETVMIRKVFAGVVVDDLAAAGAWYECVLGRPPDAAPMDGLLEWHLADTGWLQIVAIDSVREIQLRSGWGSAGSSSVALVVESIDEQLALLHANAIAV